jgi:hypothetical protein
VEGARLTSSPARAAPLANARGGGALWLVAAAAVALISLTRSSAFFHDDAYITLRYARSWLAGQGPVWNPGEYVEGYTHPLWLVGVTALGALGLDLELAARALGYASLLLLFALWFPARADPVWLLLAVSLHGVALWAGGGLETLGFSAALAAGSLGLVRAIEAGERAVADRPITRTRAALGCGLALGASGLLRPEGAGAWLLALAAIARFGDRRAAATAFAAGALPLAAWEVFRIAYYGDWLPNPARAKVAGLPLADQLGAGLAYLWRVRGEWLLPALAALAALARGRSRTSLLAASLALPVVAALLLGGGDHMPGARLALPAVIAISFAAALVSEPLGARARAVVAAIAIWQWLPTLLGAGSLDPAVRSGRAVGSELEAALPAAALVAINTAGSTAYYAPSLRFLDMLGICNREIAARRDTPLGETAWQSVPGHRKGSGRSVLSRNPDVIVLGPAEGVLGNEPRRFFLSDFELLANPEFHSRYTPYGFGRVAHPSDATRFAYGVILHLRNDAALGELRRDGTPIDATARSAARAASTPRAAIRPVGNQPRPVGLLRPLEALVAAFARLR